MEKHKVEILKNVVDCFKIDLENGIVTTSRGNHGSPDSRGRIRVSAYYNGKQYTFYTYQIIAFVGGLDLLNKDINHIDGNKLNNKLSNLEAVTRKENLNHQIENKLTNYGSKHHNTRLSEKEVLEIRLLHSTGKYTQGKLSEMFDIHISGINRIIKRENWTHI